MYIRTYLYLTVGEKTVIAKVKADSTAKSGVFFDIFVDVAKIHIFDKFSGKTITIKK